MLASKALRPTLHARRAPAQHAASTAAAAVQQRSRPPIPAGGAAASTAGYHQQAPGSSSSWSPGGSGSMPWTPPSASWWATRKRPSSSLGALNYPHVAPDPLADPAIFDEINAYSLKRQTGVSLKTLLDTGPWLGCRGALIGVVLEMRRLILPSVVQSHNPKNRAGSLAAEEVLWKGGEHHGHAADAAAGQSVVVAVCLRLTQNPIRLQRPNKG